MTTEPGLEATEDLLGEAPTSVLEWWHVWKGELADGNRLTITLGPTVMGPDDLGMDDKGIPIRERTFPMALMDPDGPEGPEATYFASFNHEPSEEEQGHEPWEEDEA